MIPPDVYDRVMAFRDFIYRRVFTGYSSFFAGKKKKLPCSCKSDMSSESTRRLIMVEAEPEYVSLWQRSGREDEEIKNESHTSEIRESQDHTGIEEYISAEEPGIERERAFKCGWNAILKDGYEKKDRSEKPGENIGTGTFQGPPDFNGELEISFLVKRKWRKRGYGTEIAGYLVAKAFSDSKINSVVARIRECNRASRKVLEKNFFEEWHREENMGTILFRITRERFFQIYGGASHG